MSAPYTVLRYPINSQLRCLVIIILDSVYGKENSQIQYPLVSCLPRTEPATAGPSTSVSDSADDDVFEDF